MGKHQVEVALTGQELELAKLCREAVVAELKSGNHKQLTMYKGDWTDPDAAVCFAHVVVRTLKELRAQGHPIRISSGKRNKGTRKNLGAPLGAYTRLVIRNDWKQPFHELGCELEKLPYVKVMLRSKLSAVA